MHLRKPPFSRRQRASIADLQRFYFTDQRNADGSPAREAMDPEARAALYVKLAADSQQRPWHYTFV